MRDSRGWPLWGLSFDAWIYHPQLPQPNVRVKIGGLNSRLHGFDFIDRALPPSSEELAQAWKPYVDTCIEAFGPARSMFESNFPPDKCGCSARVLWNAFKRLVGAWSESERAALFAETAIRTYRLNLELMRDANEKFARVVAAKHGVKP